MPTYGKNIKDKLMKDFFELYESLTEEYICSGEKSQFGGYVAVCKKGSKTSYSSQQRYSDAETAKKHAEVYAANIKNGERAALSAVKDFVAKNKDKLVTTKEELEEDYYQLVFKDKNGKVLSSLDFESKAKAERQMKVRSKRLKPEDGSYEIFKVKGSMDESLRKDIASLSSKFPEGSKVRCKKSGKTGKVLTVGKDFIKVAVDGGKVMDYKPSELTTVKESVDLEEGFAIHKDGKPFKIKGKEVVAKSKQAAMKTIDTLMDKPFNKDAKFTIVPTKPEKKVSPWHGGYGRINKSTPNWRYAERGE